MSKGVAAVGVGVSSVTLMQTSILREAEKAEQRGMLQAREAVRLLMQGLGHRKTFGGTTGNGCGHSLVTVERSARGSAARRLNREACGKRLGQSVLHSLNAAVADAVSRNLVDRSLVVWFTS